MQHPKTLLAAGLLLSAASLNAQASLTSYTANGVDFVRMQGAGFDLSFTKDGNLFQTLANSYAGGSSAFVTAVINASGGKITDTPNAFDTPSNSGYHTLSSSDFNPSTGRVNWFGAKAYVNYLNRVSYGGSDQWALPTLTDTGSPGCNFANKGTDCGYNVNTSTDPLAQLYYGELAKKGYHFTNGQKRGGGWGIFTNKGVQVAGGAVGPFTNVQSDAYWVGTEYAPAPSVAWVFATSYGSQDYASKSGQYYAWAVSPGLVTASPAAVPVPGAVWLFGTGLLGLLRLLNRRKA